MSHTQLLPLFSKLFLQVFYISTVDKSKVSFLSRSCSTWKNSSIAFSFVFLVLYCLFFVYFLFLHAITSQKKPLPYNTYSLFSRLLLFSLNHLFLLLSLILISFLSVCIQEFSEYTVCGTIKKIKSVLAYAFMRPTEFCIPSV